MLVLAKMKIKFLPGKTKARLNSEYIFLKHQGQFQKGLSTNFGALHAKNSVTSTNILFSISFRNFGHCFWLVMISHIHV